VFHVFSGENTGIRKTPFFLSRLQLKRWLQLPCRDKKCFAFQEFEVNKNQQSRESKCPKTVCSLLVSAEQLLLNPKNPNQATIAESQQMFRHSRCPVWLQEEEETQQEEMLKYTFSQENKNKSSVRDMCETCSPWSAVGTSLALGTVFLLPTALCDDASGAPVLCCLLQGLKSAPIPVQLCSRRILQPPCELQTLLVPSVLLSTWWWSSAPGPPASPLSLTPAMSPPSLQPSQRGCRAHSKWCHPAHKSLQPAAHNSLQPLSPWIAWLWYGVRPAALP